MFLFESCRSCNWDLKLFWDSEKNPELSNCLRYYGLNLLPQIIFMIIFLIDFLLNKPLIKKNRFVNYLKNYCFRFFAKILLIGSCIFELIQCAGVNDSSNSKKEPQLIQLVLLVNSLKLTSYIILLIFDALHYMKNIGLSSLSSLVVTIDWFCKIYLLFEITYLHPNSYSTNELVISIIQATCITLVFISYVFLPNLIVSYNDDNDSEDTNSLSGSKEKLNPPNKSSSSLNNSNEFSIHKRSLFSQILFFYFEEYVFFGYRNRYYVDNLMPLEENLKVDYVLRDYQKNYKEKYLKNSKFENYNILHLICILYKYFLLFNLLLFIGQICLSQFEPQILKWLVTFVSLKNDFKWHGYIFTFLLFSTSLVRMTAVGIFNRNMNYLQGWIQVILVNHIYKKALKRSVSKDGESFDTYNLMTIDVNYIIMALFFSFDCVFIPLNTSLSIYFIYREIGISIFYALTIFLIIGPLTYWVGQLSKNNQKRCMKAKDSRLKFLSDLINGIKTVKLNHFEDIFKKKITETREEEIKNSRNYQLLYGGLNVMFYILPIFLSALCFLIYLNIDQSNVLTPEKAFTVLNYFTLFKNSVIMIPRFIHYIVVSYVAAKRIRQFLTSKEKDDYISREFDEENAVIIEKNVSFSWNHDSNDYKTNDLALKNLNIKIKKNKSVALISRNGASGRSSFISALLGEMKLVPSNNPAKVNISSDMRIAFVDSKPWIENRTLKENILFGLPYDQIKYNYVLDQCLLREDIIKNLNNEDQILNKDLPLEMAQKICLGRAYYSEANLVLVDDFLSIFNDYSGKVIFDKIINSNKNGLFKNKTVIMVLNRLEFTNCFDEILEFNNGEVELVDDPNKTNNNLDNEIHSIDLRYKRSISSKLYNYENLDLPIQKNDKHDQKNCGICSNKLVDDDQEVTKLNLPIYKLYLSTWSCTWLSLVIVGYFVSMVFQVVNGNWLSYWTSNTNNRTGDDLKEYNRYGIEGYVSVFFSIANFAAIFGEIKSSIRFHKILLDKVLRLPLFFFDKTPTGSIVNRFSKDMDAIDHMVPWFFKMIFYLGFQIMSVFWVVIVTFPMACIIILVMLVLYILVFTVFLRTVIRVRVLELQTRTVLYNRFEELSCGLRTIIAYDKSKQFTKILNQRLEDNVKCAYNLYIAFKWLSIRNEMIGLIILVTTSLFSIYNSDTLNSGEVALVLNFASILLGLFMALMALLAEFFINFVSIERIHNYLSLDEENDEYSNSHPPNEWPSQGKIKFENYSSTYTECREPAISDLDFEIDKHTLVSICGRSASGKTSLALSIFNCLQSVKGRILIDNIDIRKISLKSLRKKISIFPQDAHLFSGSLYFNLDPERKYTDSELWTVLEYVGLKDQILSLPGNLNYEIDSQKSTLSLAQRQLLCLARTMLNKSKVMIIDETDCQFDLETEARLRELLRTNFKERTILLITKNIENIQAADSVLFLNDGHVQDYKSPQEIFGDRNNNVEILDILNNNE